MKRAIKLSMIIFLFVLLCACVVINTGAPTPQVEEFNSVEATARMALTLTAWPTDPGQPGITITPDQGTVTDEPCAYVWASYSAPDVDTYLAGAISAAGMDGISAHGSYYGEDCVTASGIVVSSGVMYTDLFFDVAVPSITDEQSLGIVLGQITDLVAAIPEGTLIGSFNGNLGVHFIGADSDRNIWIELESILEYRRQGLDGAALMSAVGD